MKSLKVTIKADTTKLDAQLDALKSVWEKYPDLRGSIFTRANCMSDPGCLKIEKRPGLDGNILYLTAQLSPALEEYLEELHRQIEKEMRPCGETGGLLTAAEIIAASDEIEKDRLTYEPGWFMSKEESAAWRELAFKQKIITKKDAGEQ